MYLFGKEFGVQSFYGCISYHISLMMITCIAFMLILRYNLFFMCGGLLKRIQEWVQRKSKCQTHLTGARSSTGTSGYLEDSSIICEILSRLPVRSLVRFKCVCKQWRFLIEEDSYFIHLHLDQSKKHPNLLFIVPVPCQEPCPSTPGRLYLRGWTTSRRRISFSNVELERVDLMVEGKGREASIASIDTQVRRRVDEFPDRNAGYFGPVNGLMGFHSTKGICIYNVSTRERSPWIESEFPRMNVVEGKKEITHNTPFYEMGFDPATKKHKVIRIWRTYKFIEESYHDGVCDVLTVGDKIWRRIELPPFQLAKEDYRRTHTVHVNGFIYYCTSTFMKAGELGNDKIVAFDVGAEKFRVITVPTFILNQPLRHSGMSSKCLIELEGRLGLISRMNDYTAKLWVFDDDAHGNKTSKSSSSSEDSWTEVTIELPFVWTDRRDIYFHSIAGTDQIVIESHDDRSFTRHFYNWKTKSCEEIRIRELEYYPAIQTVSTLVESLLHVR